MHTFGEAYCPECGSNFTKTGSNHVYCSRKCQGKKYPPKEYDQIAYQLRKQRLVEEGILPSSYIFFCRYCKKRQEVEFGPRKFCSSKCSRDFHNESRRDPKIRLFARCKKYGISVDEYEKMRERQGDACDICQRRTQFCIDHDHKTKIVRGLLCRLCNQMIGKYWEDPVLFERAAQYLRKHQG